MIYFYLNLVQMDQLLSPSSLNSSVVSGISGEVIALEFRIDQKSSMLMS